MIFRNWKLRISNLRQFWNITSGIYAKCQVQIMLLFVYTTTRKRFAIFTSRYFKLSWNTTALSQSNCRNFSCSSIMWLARTRLLRHAFPISLMILRKKTRLFCSLMSFKTYFLSILLFPAVCCNVGWQVWTWIETFSSFNAIPTKILPKLIMVCAPWGSLFDIFILNSTGAFYVWLKPAGALGYFLGGYVPPAIPNWHPVF